MFAAASSLPKWEIVDWIQSLTADESSTWRRVERCFLPSGGVGREETAVLRAASLISASERRAPCEARRVAVARPMPEAAPVTAI